MGWLTTQWSILLTNPDKSDLICKNNEQQAEAEVVPSSSLVKVRGKLDLVELS